MGDRAYDFARVPGPAPQEIKDNGGEGVLTYSFRGQSGHYLDGIRAAGLASVWIWERNTDSIFNGYDYAVSECRLHEANAKPGELTYVACDTNDGGVGGRQLAPFLQGWSDTTREPTFGVYGSSGAIRQAQAFGGKCQRYWGVVNWINGGGPNNAPQNIDYWRGAGAHLIQLIGSPIPGTDENLILKPEWATLGEDDDMAISDEQMATLAGWMQDQAKVVRDSVLEQLTGSKYDPNAKGVVAGWENDTRTQVVNELKAYLDEKLAGMSAQGGGGGRSDEELTALIDASVDRLTLSTKPQA